MGMDIYGLNPTLTEERPDINYETSNEEERKIFWEQLDAWEEANPGYYFRANLWSWRPIENAINLVNEHYKLGFNVEGFGVNSGKGLKDQEECNLLAKHLQEYINVLELKEDEVMYICMGMWVEESGRFLNDEDEAILNEQYPIGEVLYGSIITKDGKIVRPSHGISYNHFKKFITFLENCGGFEIW